MPIYCSRWYNGTAVFTKKAMIIKYTDIIKITLAPFLIYILDEVLYYVWADFAFAYNTDIYLHLIGGMSIAASSIVALSLAERADWIKIKNAMTAFCVVVALVIVAAVMWEFYEFIHDRLYGSHFQPSNFDTMKDLFMGTLGGSLWYAAHYIRKRKAL